jgi:hypothetical protein
MAVGRAQCETPPMRQILPHNLQALPGYSPPPPPDYLISH